MKQSMPYLKIILLLTGFLFFNYSSLFAQHSVVNVTVKGLIKDSLTNETIPYVTIKIVSADNPANLVKAVATDENGRFSFTMNKSGKYIFLSEYIGKKTYSKEIEIGNIKTIDLGNIEMSDNAQALNEVVVSAQKPLVQVDLDKITYSMESDPESKTNNVLEMLKKVPMVTVDGEENIQLKGSSSFKIYMNGKPSNMISNNPKDVLRSMPANTVKDIQVITDPGAKYDAEGVTGIINIITQKNSSMGGYTANLNARIDDRGGFGGGGYLTMKVGKIGFNGGYNYYKWKQPTSDVYGFLEDLRNISDANNNKYLYRNGTSKYNGNSQYGSGELSYEIDTLNLINVGFNRYHGNSKSKSDWFNQMFDINEDLYYKYNQQGNNKSTYGGTDLNVDYQRTFKKKDQLLTASYRFSVNPNDSEADVNILDVIGNIPQGAINNRQYSDADQKEHTFQVDFVTPFGKVHSLETGLKYIIRLNQSNSGRENLNPDGTWVLLDRVEDKFRHEQDILAAYGGYSAKFKKWGLKTGVRYEATWLNAKYPKNTVQDFKTDYSNLVPSATVTYQIKPAQNIRLGYNMRISRPGIYQLNPYQNNSDASFVRIGNPELDAVKSHSINSNYGFFTPKLNFNMNISYNFENNGIEQITTREGNVNTTTYDNIGKRKGLNMSAYVNWSITDKLRFYSNIWGGYTDVKTNIEASTAPSDYQNLSNHGFQGSFYGGAQYSFPKAFRVYANAGVFSPHIGLESKGSTFSFHSFSASKGFMNERLTFRAFVQNLFQKDREFTNKQTTPIFYSETRNTNRMRSFGLSVSFRFGEMKAQIKKTKRGITNDDGMSGGDQGGSQGGGQGTSM